MFRHRGFRWLWGAETISQFGSQFSQLAIPVLAVLVLHAEAWQLGILNAADTAAFLLVGLPAGAWVDRMLKRRVMIVADLVRALALATIPLLWWLGVLQIWQLVIVGVVVGTATVFFDVSYQSYIPILVESRQVADANSKLEASFEVARIGGPGLAGALLTVISAPLLLLADAISFLVSAAALTRIRDNEVRTDPADRLGLGREIAEGVRFVAGQPLIRRIVGTTAASNFFSPSRSCSSRCCFCAPWDSAQARSASSCRSVPSVGCSGRWPRRTSPVFSARARSSRCPRSRAPW